MRTVKELTDAIASAPLALGDGERRSPADPVALADFEFRWGLKLPADVRAFYSRMDGTDMMGADHGLITLWPLDRWNHLDHYEAPQYPTAVPGDAIVFADHSLWCWAYTAQFESGSERMILRIVGGGTSAPIAETFTEFLELIVTGSRRLYGEAG
jgi:hypothetical protein